MDIDGSAIVEELEVEGNGKKPKQATGFEDHTVTIEIVLMDDIKGKTKEEKLKVIQNIFRTKGQKVPKVYNIVNRHTAQRGINKVIFKKLTTKESNKNDQMTVSITCIEYEAITVTATSSKSGSSTTANGSAASSATSGSASSSALSAGYQSYLSNNRGTAPKIGDKTSSSPANNISAPKK